MKTRQLDKQGDVISKFKRVLGNIRDKQLGKPAGAAVRHISRANNYRDSHDWPQAREEYAQALRIDPSLTGIWVQYGHSLKESGQVGEALEAYDKAIALEPDLADTYLQRGHALKLQGLREYAVQAYAKAALLDPALTPAWDELSNLGHAASDLTTPELIRLAEPQAVNTDYDISVALDKNKAFDPRGNYQSLDSLLSQYNLLPKFIEIFDVEFYVYDQRLGAMPRQDRLARCLIHFCETGLRECAAINGRHHFNPGFYNEVYNSTFRMSDMDAYRHWLNSGLLAKHAPNETVWLQDVQELDLQSFDSIDLDYYQAVNPSLQILQKRTDLIRHFIEGGIVDAENVVQPSTDNAIVFRAIAKRAKLHGDVNLAIKILQRLISVIPLDFDLLHEYADRIQDIELYPVSASIYQQVIIGGAATRWTHMLLAKAQRAERQYRQAYETLAAGAVAFPQFPKIKYEKSLALDAYFHASVREYEGLGRLNRITEGQQIIAEFSRVATPQVPVRLSSHPVRAIALFGLLELAQCRFYRMDQKVEHLERAGFTVEVFDPNVDLIAFLARIIEFQAVIFYRLAPLPNVIPAIQAAQTLGLLTFYEIDDLLFLPHEYPGRFESFAGQITRETYTMLAMGVPLFARAMAMCDYALASTPTLAREMAKIVKTGRSFVHRNGMGSDHERYLDYTHPLLPADQPVTIFYGSGTRAHKEDFQELIEPALIEIAKRHGAHVRFVLVGWLPISEALRRHAISLSVLEPIWDVHDYWTLLQASDINLAVLKPSLNVDCKSEIKWMEAAMFGIPSIVSRTATYAEVIEEGKTGFLCDTVADWVRALEALVTDAELRQRVGNEAQLVVRKNYCIDAMSCNIRTIFDEVSGDLQPRRQKILFVNVFFAPQTNGGATRVLYDNIRHLTEFYHEEFELEVFTCIDEADEDYVVESYIQDGVRVTGVTRSVAGERTVPHVDARMYDIFSRYLATSRPDLVHFHCIQRLTVAVVNATLDLNIPYVITAHDTWWISDNQFLIDDEGEEQSYDYANPMNVLAQHGQAAFLRMQALRPALFGATAILGVSQSFSALYERCGVAKVSTIANGVSSLPAYFRTAGQDGYVRLAHVGGMSRHKGYLLLKYALMSRSFEHLHLFVVDHARPSGYRHHEVWGNTPVTVAGRFPQSGVTELYGQIDVLMAPSLWPESFGLATREAMACGCWVVASDRGAIGSDVIEGINGHIIDVSGLDGLIFILDQIDQNWKHYREPPQKHTDLRTAAQQGDELADLYRVTVNLPRCLAPGRGNVG